MTRDHLFGIHQKACNEALSLMRSKNSDYADQESPFANFEMFGTKHTLLGMTFRMGDKISRLFRYALKGQFQVKETVRDTCLDLINYAVLFLAYWSDEEK